MSRTSSPGARPVYAGPFDAVDLRLDSGEYVVVKQGAPCPDGIDVAALSADWVLPSGAAPTPAAPSEESK